MTLGNAALWYDLNDSDVVSTLSHDFTRRVRERYGIKVSRQTSLASVRSITNSLSITGKLVSQDYGRRLYAKDFDIDAALVGLINTFRPHLSLDEKWADTQSAMVEQILLMREGE